MNISCQAETTSIANVRMSCEGFEWFPKGTEEEAITSQKECCKSGLNDALGTSFTVLDSDRKFEFVFGVFLEL